MVYSCFTGGNCETLTRTRLCQSTAFVVTEESVTVQTIDGKKKVRNTVNPI